MRQSHAGPLFSSATSLRVTFQASLKLRLDETASREATAEQVGYLINLLRGEARPRLTLKLANGRPLIFVDFSNNLRFRLTSRGNAEVVGNLITY